MIAFKILSSFEQIYVSVEITKRIFFYLQWNRNGKIKEYSFSVCEYKLSESS